MKPTKIRINRALEALGGSRKILSFAASLRLRFTRTAASAVRYRRAENYDYNENRGLLDRFVQVPVSLQM
jgi:hypothetical protein